MSNDNFRIITTIEPICDFYYPSESSECVEENEPIEWIETKPNKIKIFHIGPIGFRRCNGKLEKMPKTEDSKIRDGKVKICRI